jgi:hypothetical protein
LVCYGQYLGTNAMAILILCHGLVGRISSQNGFMPAYLTPILMTSIKASSPLVRNKNVVKIISISMRNIQLKGG